MEELKTILVQSLKMYKMYWPNLGGVP